MINKKNSKICELEATVTRLQLMYEHANEVNAKKAESQNKNEDNSNDNEEKTVKSPKKKCSFENSGKCKKPDCAFIHPKKTCQAHSKYGSCPSESICEHRHPTVICRYLQADGFCYKGERCKMRHPIEYSSHFLGQNLPSPHRGFARNGAQGGLNQEEDFPQFQRRRGLWDNQKYNGRVRGRGATRGLGNQM